MEASRQNLDRLADREYAADPYRVARRERPDNDEGGEIDVRRLVAVVWSYRYLLVLATLVSTLVAYGYNLMLPKQYRAMATVFITPPTLPNDLKPASFSVEAYERLANSDFVNARVDETLRKNNVLTAGEGIGRLWTTLYPSREPSKPYLPLIGLSAESTDPKKAQIVANSWATLFAAEAAKLAVVSKSGSVDFILEEFPKASAAMIETDRKLKALQERQARESTALRAQAAQSLRQAQLASREAVVVALEKDLVTLHVDLEAARAKLDQVEKELAQTPREITIMRSITDDALWEAIAKNTGATDPAKVPASVANARIESREPNPLHRKLQERAAEERVAFSGLRSRERDLLKQTDQARRAAAAAQAELLRAEQQLAAQVRAQSLEAAPAQQAYDEAKARYEKLREKVADAQLVKAERDSDVKIGAYAELPKSPHSPNVRRNVLLTTGVSFAAALLVALLAAILRGQLGSQRPAPPPPAARLPVGV